MKTVSRAENVLMPPKVKSRLVYILVGSETPMRTVGAYEAKTHLSDLLKEVSKGARISITRKGVPVAMLVPAPHADKASVLEAIRKIKEFRRGITLGGVPIREMIEEGRRR